MGWCFSGAAIMVALVGLAALRFQPRHIRLPGPASLVRGCAALICLLVALSFVGLALLAGGWQP